MTKSKKHTSQVREEVQAETINNDGESRNTGKRKKQKRRNSNKKEPRKDGSGLKSIKQSIRNKFQRMKGNGRKGQPTTTITSNSSVASSAGSSELDDLMMNFANPGPPAKKVENRRPVPLEMMKTSTSQVAIEGKKTQPSKQKISSKKVSKANKAKEQREIELPQSKDLMDNVQKKQQRKEKSRERRSKSLNIEPEKAYKKFEMKAERIKKKNKAPKQEPRDFAKDFRSFSDSSDYSDSASDGSNSTNESSVYSDPGFEAVSYSVSGTESAFQSDFSHSSRSSRSFGSSAYSSDETEGVTMRTERSAWKRNPETDRGRSPPKQRRKKRIAPSGHISSPRTSPRKTNSNHIRSPRRSTRSSNGEKRFFREDEEDSDDSSYVSGSSYDNSESDVSSHSSGSSYSERSHDDYYTTSYDEDPRNLRDSTFSGSWTEGPLSTYGSGETDFTRPREYPTLLKDISTQSMEENQERYETRSTAAVDSRDLGSIEENEDDEFSQEREAVENIEKERANAKKALEEEQGVMSWILGGSKEPKAVSTKEEDDTGITVESPRGKSSVLHASSPAHSARETMTIHSPHSPRSFQSPISPRSAASSMKDFIARDRRSAIFSDDDKSNDVGPTMSPGCSVNLDQILVGGDSMPGSYGGLKEGEFLLSNKESEPSEKQEKIDDELSVSMKGSDTFEADADGNKSIRSAKCAAPQEIAFLPRSPGVPSPLSRSGRPKPLLLDDGKDEEEEESSFLYCCFSPQTGIQQGLLPSAGVVEKNFNDMAEAKIKNQAFNFNDDAISALPEDDGDDDDVEEEDDDDSDDDTTCASSIHTDGFRDLKDSEAVSSPSKSGTLSSPSDHELNREDKLQYFTVPIENAEDQEQKNESLSSEGKPEYGLGSKDEEEPAKRRIKAESLDDYDISEIVHGRRPYKSKTDDDGLPVSAASASNPTGRRERRKMALKAHREFLYKSRSIDSNASFTKEGAAHEDEKSKVVNGDGNSIDPSLLSNSIVQEDLGKMQSEGKPDALIDLVRNAFNSMMLPKNDESEPSQVNNDNVNVATSEKSPVQSDNNAPTSFGPIDDVLEVAFRFFSPPEEMTSPLIKEAQKGQKEILMVTNFDPNPAAKGVTVEEESNCSIAESESDESASSEDTSSSMGDDSNLSDTAVVRNSRLKITSPVAITAKNDSHFNAAGIPLELRPKKIWRAFDSGVGVSQSVAITGPFMATGEMENNNNSTEPKSNRLHDTAVDEQKNPESRSKLGIETRESINDGPSGMRLSTSPRYRRRAELKRQKRQQDKLVSEDHTGGRGEESGSELSPRKEQPGSPKQHSNKSRSPMETQEPSFVDQAWRSTVGLLDHTVSSSPSPAYRSNNYDANISDIRARVKQRQRSKSQYQQYQQKQQSPKATVVSNEAKRRSTRHSSSTKVVQVRTTTDRRDDSFSEFYDAVPFDDGHIKYDKNTEKRTRKYHVPTTDERDSIYPGLNNKESILGGTMSLD
mmetsp:Transcript_9131/g.22672  ORF Transcript_9131/g.22672 Transcript_9131/m.22672 type:complete len:1479 (+) Transcript_9131:313-4749(+)